MHYKIINIIFKSEYKIERKCYPYFMAELLDYLSWVSNKLFMSEKISLYILD